MERAFRTARAAAVVALVAMVFPACAGANRATPLMRSDRMPAATVAPDFFIRYPFDITNKLPYYLKTFHFRNSVCMHKINVSPSIPTETTGHGFVTTNGISGSCYFAWQESEFVLEIEDEASPRYHTAYIRFTKKTGSLWTAKSDFRGLFCKSAITEFSIHVTCF